MLTAVETPLAEVTMTDWPPFRVSNAVALEEKLLRPSRQDFGEQGFEVSQTVGFSRLRCNKQLVSGSSKRTGSKADSARRQSIAAIFLPDKFEPPPREKTRPLAKTLQEMKSLGRPANGCTCGQYEEADRLCCESVARKVRNARVESRFGRSSEDTEGDGPGRRHTHGDIGNLWRKLQTFGCHLQLEGPDLRRVIPDHDRDLPTGTLAHRNRRGIKREAGVRSQTDLNPVTKRKHRRFAKVRLGVTQANSIGFNGKLGGVAINGR